MTDNSTDFDRNIEGINASTLPSRRCLLLFAVLLPAVVALSSQAILILASPIHLQFWFYPWLVLCTAVLSWCAGRYLWPIWLSWLIFAWCCALLDILTIAACLGSTVDIQYAFVLVSAQISLVVLWAILETSSWQWRLPGVLAVAAAVWGFARIFIRTPYGWYSCGWFVLWVLTAIVVVILCASLRLLGFSLCKAENSSTNSGRPNSLRSYQFGVKHMLFWATAMVPMLLIGRGIDIVVLKSLGEPGTFQAVLLAIVVATINLTAIWAALSSGALILRLTVLLCVAFSLSIGVSQYARYMHSVLMNNPRRYDNVMHYLFSTDVSWTSWLCLDAALLAALLLFLRANGYRLERTNRDD